MTRRCAASRRLIGFAPIILLMLWRIHDISKEKAKRAKKNDHIAGGGLSDDRNAATAGFSGFGAGAGFGGGGTGMSTM